MTATATTTMEREASSLRALGAGVIAAPLHRVRTKAVGVSAARPAPVAPPAPRPMRVARMLALAHEIVRLIDVGTFADQAEAARVLGFTRARVSQLLDLTLLAPHIQDELLIADVAAGRDVATERSLRAIAAARTWREQRLRWSRNETGARTVC